MKAKLWLALIFALLLILILVYPQTIHSQVPYLALGFLFIALYFASRKKGLEHGFAYLRMGWKGSALSLVLWSLAALLASAAATLAVSTVSYALGAMDSDNVAAKILALPLPALILAITLSPIGEEALFRGLLFRKLAEISRGSRFPAWMAAALLSSAIFALMHFAYGSITEVAVTFVVGVVLCYFVQRTNSLLPAIAAHAAFNLLSIIFVLVLP